MADERMLYEIINAVAHNDHTVTITWSDGAQGTIDFAPVVAKGKIYTAMKNAGYFVREMRVLPKGIGLSWPPGVDFSSDGLRTSAFPNEDASETADFTKPGTGSTHTPVG
jgi:hypothetical protein